MMDEPIKTIRGESGDTFIRPSNHWGDRAAPIMWACFWLFLGEDSFSSKGFVQIAHESGSFDSGFWLPFMLWLIVFALICARIAWSFFGATKISVSSDELVVRHCMGGEAIFTSDRIKLSTIRDVLIEEKEFYFKGNTMHRWVLVVHLDDGSVHRVAKFTSELGANEFMSRYVQ